MPRCLDLEGRPKASESTGGLSLCSDGARWRQGLKWADAGDGVVGKREERDHKGDTIESVSGNVR